MRQKLIFILILLSIKAYSQWPPITLINNVEYTDSIYNNNNAACGFLLKFNSDTFAITAKHVLLVAKHKSMTTTNFQGKLKKWSMHPKFQYSNVVVIDQLINEDNIDSLTKEYLMKTQFNYVDWLIFSIKENKANVTPLVIRSTKINHGEPLYVVGWTYKDTLIEQKTYRYSYVKENGTHFNMKIIDGPQNAAGLSGSPVLDSDGLLVGIISDGYFDPKTREWMSSPCSTKSLIDVLKRHGY